MFSQTALAPSHLKHHRDHYPYYEFYKICLCKVTPTFWPPLLFAHLAHVVSSALRYNVTYLKVVLILTV